MRKSVKYIIDSWVTSIMGIIIYIITTIFIWKGIFDFVWEGIAGYVLGTVLLLFPRSIETFIKEYLKSKQSDNSSGYNNEPPKFE